MADDTAALATAGLIPYRDSIPELNPAFGNFNPYAQNARPLELPISAMRRRKKSPTDDPRWSSPQFQNYVLLNHYLFRAVQSGPFSRNFFERLRDLSKDPLFAHDALSLLAVITIKKSTISEPESAELKRDAIIMALKILRNITRDSERLAVLDSALQSMYSTLAELHRRHVPMGATVREKAADETEADYQASMRKEVVSELENFYIFAFQRSLEKMRYPKPGGGFFYDRQGQADALFSLVNGRLTYGLVSSPDLPFGFSIKTYQRARIEAARATLVAFEPSTAQTLEGEMNIDDPSDILAFPNPDQHTAWMNEYRTFNERRTFDASIVMDWPTYIRSIPRKIGQGVAEVFSTGAKAGRDIGWRMGPFAILPSSMALFAGAGFVVGTAINGYQPDQIANECFAGSMVGILFLAWEDGVSREGKKFHGFGSHSGTAVGAILGLVTIPAYRFLKPVIKPLAEKTIDGLRLARFAIQVSAYNAPDKIPALGKAIDASRLARFAIGVSATETATKAADAFRLARFATQVSAAKIAIRAREEILAVWPETSPITPARVAWAWKNTAKASQFIFSRRKIRYDAARTNAELQPILELSSQLRDVIQNGNSEDGRFFDRAYQLAEDPRYTGDVLSLLMLATVQKSNVSPELKGNALTQATQILIDIQDPRRRVHAVQSAIGRGYLDLNSLTDLDIGRSQSADSVLRDQTIPPEAVTSDIESLLIKCFDGTLDSVRSDKERARIILDVASSLGGRQLPNGFSINPFNEVYFNQMLRSIRGMTKKDNPEQMKSDAERCLYGLNPVKYARYKPAERNTLLLPVRIEARTHGI